MYCYWLLYYFTTNWTDVTTDATNKTQVTIIDVKAVYAQHNTNIKIM